MHLATAHRPNVDPTWREGADSLPSFVFSLTPRGDVDFVNRFGRLWLGLRPEDGAGALFAAVHDDDRPFATARMQACVGERLPFAETFRLRNSNGIYRLVRCSIDPRHGGNTTLQWFGAVTDVEERAQALASRDATESRLETFLQTVAQIVWTADATGWIDWYNDRWFEYTGQTPEQAAGWGWQDAHHPEDFPTVMERWPHSIATGEPFGMEFRLRSASGTYRWFLTRVVPLRAADGTLLRWYGSNTDIEDRKRAEERSARVAATLQEAFLPERLPTRKGIRFDALYAPAEREDLIGGDWYDALDLQDGRIMITCGDVIGHGLKAAVAAARIRQAVRFAAMERAEPSSVLERVNCFVNLEDDVIATAAVAVFDPVTFAFTYALAGHPAPAIARSGSDVSFGPHGGLPLGVTVNLALETTTTTLLPDAVVAFYTDGLTDFAREDTVAAERNLLAAVGELVGNTVTPRPALAVKQRVMGDATSRDDVALLVLQCSEIDASRLTFDESSLVKKWRFHSSDALTARKARHDLMRYVAEHAAPGEDLFAAELALGEILANTVEHAPGLVEVLIDWTAERPTVTVCDSGPGMDGYRGALPSDLYSENGRGMFLITSLATEISVRPSPGYGTELKATLPLRRVPRSR